MLIMNSDTFTESLLYWTFPVSLKKFQVRCHEKGGLDLRSVTAPKLKMTKTLLRLRPRAHAGKR